MVFPVPFLHAWVGCLPAAETSRFRVVGSVSNSGPPSRRNSERPEAEDTVMRRLSPVDKDRLGVDAWEPSLLRKMLRAKGGKPVEPSDV
jgi:hypothetical protein